MDDNRLLLIKYNRVSKQIKQYLGSFFIDSELTFEQAEVLHLIAVLDTPSAPTPSDLRDFLGVRASSITSILNALEAKGYMTRQHSTEDGRHVRLYITEKGEQYDLKARNTIFSAVDAVFSGITPGEKELLQRVLSLMANNIKSLG